MKSILTLILTAFFCTYFASAAIFRPVDSADDLLMVELLNKRGTCPSEFTLKSDGSGLYYCILEYDTRRDNKKQTAITGRYCDMEKGYIGFQYDRSIDQKFKCPSSLHTVPSSGNSMICRMDHISSNGYQKNLDSFCDYFKGSSTSKDRGMIGYKFEVDGEPECLTIWPENTPPKPRLIVKHNNDQLSLAIRFYKSNHTEFTYTVSSEEIKDCNSKSDNRWRQTATNQCYEEYSRKIKTSELQSGGIWEMIDERIAKDTLTIFTSYSSSNDSCNVTSYTHPINLKGTLTARVEDSKVADFKVLRLVSDNKRTVIEGKLVSLQKSISFSNVRMTNAVVEVKQGTLGELDLLVTSDENNVLGKYELQFDSLNADGKDGTTVMKSENMAIHIYMDVPFGQMNTELEHTVSSDGKLLLVSTETNTKGRENKFHSAFMCCVPYGSVLSVPTSPKNNIMSVGSCLVRDPLVTTSVYALESSVNYLHDSMEGYTVAFDLRKLKRPNYAQSCALLTISKSTNTDSFSILQTKREAVELLDWESSHVESMSIVDLPAYLPKKKRTSYFIPVVVTVPIVASVLFNIFVVFPLAIALYTFFKSRNQEEIAFDSQPIMLNTEGLDTNADRSSRRKSLRLFEKVSL